MPATVLDVRLRTRVERIRFEFSKMGQGPIALTNLESPEEGERFVGYEQLKLR